MSLCCAPTVPFGTPISFGIRLVSMNRGKKPVFGSPFFRIRDQSLPSGKPCASRAPQKNNRPALFVIPALVDLLGHDKIV
jgi:hypothetical protein